MAHEHHVPSRAQRPRPLVLLVLLAACGCSNSGAGRPKLRQPNEHAPRTTGCIDTPFMGPDHRSSIVGVQCGREASPNQVTLGGRVVAQTSGLPGAGLEHLRVYVHAIDGALQLDRLGPVLGETETGPQGAFAISVTAVGECLVVVRAKPDGPLLSARRVEAQSTGELLLLVPQDPQAPE